MFFISVKKMNVFLMTMLILSKLIIHVDCINSVGSILKKTGSIIFEVLFRIVEILAYIIFTIILMFVQAYFLFKGFLMDRPLYYYLTK